MARCLAEIRLRKLKTDENSSVLVNFTNLFLFIILLNHLLLSAALKLILN